LIPLEFIALGVLVFQTPSGTSNRFAGRVLAAALAISLVPLFRPAFYDMSVPHNLLWHYPLGLGAMAIAIALRRRTAWALALIGISITSFGLVPRYPGAAWTTPYNGLSQWRRLTKAVETIVAVTPKNRLAIFWIDNVYSEYRAVMCAMLTHMWSMWSYP